MDIKLVELDVNDTCCFLWAGLNPHPGQDPYGETILEAAQTFGGCDRILEGDVIGVTFLELGSNFELRSGNRVDVILGFYVLEEKVVEGVSFWIDHMRVGEIEFSVEVQGEIPPEHR